ncbi:MAG: hypothetical protein LBR47_06665 [Spirochaetaceae bacterium]|jgi:hypothetical protein|nr:hypothetical protein [Spirochaetaceae bacterium]
MNRKLSLASAGLALVVLLSLWGCSGNKLVIDMSMDALKENYGGNYFNWTAGSTSVKDKFDAATGASIGGSTEGFNIARYDADATKKLALPGSIRSLVLYPVSSWETAVNDAFTVDVSGSRITVRFVHRDTAYQLVTDASGKLDMAADCKLAKVADNIGGSFELKPEFVKAGGDVTKMADLDWSKITLVADTSAADASRRYEGSLDMKYSGGILTMKGSLTEKK